MLRIFRLSLLFFVFLGVAPLQAFTTGFNQSWFKDQYAYQWQDGNYDKEYAEKLLILNKEAGSQLLRVWLLEGSWLSQFQKERKTGVLTIRPDILKNLQHFFKLARKHKVKLNLTFLDGNSFRYVIDRPELSAFWWNIFNDKFGALDQFYDHIISPVYKMISDDFRDVVTQIDLVNEVNAIAEFKLFENEKNAMSHFLCRLGKGSPAPVTASLGWANAEDLFFSGFLNQSCLSFFDLHFYNDNGAISRCEEYKLLAQNGIFLQLGEFGQSSMAHDDALQSLVTKNFLNQSKLCGFKSALAWRLIDQRETPNPEERFSYILNNRPRPAYGIFRDESLSSR
jgi:hypothetical protein